MIIKKHKEETKLPEIARAAVKLFAHKGVAATTIRDIAQEAGVAEGTLYRHYDSKDELARDLLAKNLDRFTELIDEKLAQSDRLFRKLHGLAEVFATSYEENQELARFILFQHASEMSALPKKIRMPRHAIAEHLKAHKQTGELSKDTDVELLASMMLGALSQWLLSRAYGELRGDLRDKTVEAGQFLCRMTGVRS